MERAAQLKAALQQLPVPEPSPDLLQRIVHSRAMGARVNLPSGGVAVPWRWIGAAAAVAILIGGSWIVSLSVSRIGESGTPRDPLAELLRETTLWPSYRSPQGSTRQPKYPLVLTDSLDPSRLTEGVWTYRSTTTNDGVLTEPSFIGTTRLRMARGTYDGSPAWIVTTGRSFRFREQVSDFADTVYLDAATLRPRYAVEYEYKRRTRTVQSFSSDRGTQSITITGPTQGVYRGAMRLPFPPQAVFTSNLSLHRLHILVPAIPLTTGWRGSLYHTGMFRRIAPSTLVQRALPLDLRVRGTDRVSVAAGSFDCWRVEVEILGGLRWNVWVARNHRWIVKTERRWGDRVITEVLESYEPGL